jgi:hypothetical protein
MRKLVLAAVVMASLIGCGGPEDSDASGDEALQDEPAPLSCGKDTWKNYAGKFFKNDCASCHANTFTSSAAVDASGARAKISSGEMPKNKRLTAAQKKRILAWFACGSP